MTPLAYYHHSVGVWLAETVARGLIYRLIWRATAAIPLLELAAFAGIALVILVYVMNRRA